MNLIYSFIVLLLLVACDTGVNPNNNGIDNIITDTVYVDKNYDEPVRFIISTACTVSCYDAGTNDLLWNYILNRNLNKGYEDTIMRPVTDSIVLITDNAMDHREQLISPVIRGSFYKMSYTGMWY